MKYTQQQINSWYEHKSNKEVWIENQEKQDDVQEETTSMEEKLEELS